MCASQLLPKTSFVMSFCRKPGGFATRKMNARPPSEPWVSHIPRKTSGPGESGLTPVDVTGSAETQGKALLPKV